MMTLKEFGENLKNLNEVFEQLRKKYQKPEIGKTIEVAGINWLVLDKLEKGYFAISEDFYGRDREFDDNCNDWKSSDLRNELNTDLRKKIESELGTDSLVEFERNLLSLDGQTEYGTCRDYVSLISVDEYRKYRKLLRTTEHRPQERDGMRYSVEMEKKSDGQSKLTVQTASDLRSGNLVEIILTGQTLAARYLTERSHLQKLHRRESQTVLRNILSMQNLRIS